MRRTGPGATVSAPGSAALQKLVGAGRGVAMDWNDVRALVAVAEHGSTLAAGRALGVSQTTVARRIAALEAALGLALFEKLPSGYRLTAAGEALLPEARALGHAASRLEAAAGALTRDVSGTVRITMEELLAVTLLPPILAELAARHSALRIEIDVAEGLRDLVAGEADIALRFCARPEGAGLVARRLCDGAWTLFASRAYAACTRLPATVAEIRGHPLVAGGGPAVARVYDAWIARHGLADAVSFRHGSATGLLAAVRAGAGLAMLPVLVAAHEPDLVPCFPPGRPAARGYWLVAPERLRDAPRVRVVLDHVARELRVRARAAEARLEGGRAAG